MGLIPLASRLNQVKLKLAGCPRFFFSFSRKTDNSLLTVVKENTGQSKHGKRMHRVGKSNIWTQRSHGRAVNSDRCDGRTGNAVKPEILRTRSAFEFMTEETQK